MIITKELYDTIQPREIFRSVTTKYQRFERPGEWELTFVCIKGAGPEGSWAMYCGFSDTPHDVIADMGSKVYSEDIIRSMCPCDDEVYKLYRP